MLQELKMRVADEVAKIVLNERYPLELRANSSLRCKK
jgi:hypothetical protein